MNTLLYTLGNKRLHKVGMSIKCMKNTQITRQDRYDNTEELLRLGYIPVNVNIKVLSVAVVAQQKNSTQQKLQLS